MPPQPADRRRLALLAALLVVLAAAQGAELPPLVSSRPGNVHALLLTDCAKYQDWQTIAGAFAWRESGQPGSITRVANCNEKDRGNYSQAMLAYVDTHMAPEAAYNAELKDWYAAYNKPTAVQDWLAHNPAPPEEWLLLLDADMLLRRPFLPEHFNLSKGWAVAGHYDYMKGVTNDLALRHIPQIPPRNDTLAGPAGRRGDVVGAPYFMRVDDARALAPLWHEYTVRVRNDSLAYKDSGDAAAEGKVGERIWIAEMYGYAFGAAVSGLWHKWGEDFMLYPGYTPSVVPRNIHYGLLYHIDDWSWDKHWYFAFDVHKCPPWNLGVDKPQEGVFPPPPHPDALQSKDYLTEYRDLLAVHTMALINAAVCDYHRRNCPAGEQLEEVCGKAERLYADVKASLTHIEELWDCVDHNAECKGWAERGECKSSERYMREHCAVSCGRCTPRGAFVPKPERDAARDAARADAGRAAEAAAAAAGAGAAAASPVASPAAGVDGRAEAGAGAAAGAGAGAAAGGGDSEEDTIGDLLHQVKAERERSAAKEEGAAAAEGQLQQGQQQQEQQQQAAAEAAASPLPLITPVEDDSGGAGATHDHAATAAAVLAAAVASHPQAGSQGAQQAGGGAAGGFQSRAAGRFENLLTPRAGAGGGGGGGGGSVPALRVEVALFGAAVVALLALVALRGRRQGWSLPGLPRHAKDRHLSE
ncbi:peptidyl serine alpha-galactosyltransferase [Raphidocelis subcapitata]|uniref:Peptidyl serine alpha-galactosyltransferase n=1 Tax=Raphidocelis subcapitata TaxID=307507 RepID=A0A2V0P932_9CHLO|nr:peptidyl serine alpha-galactosyltransferase [Raphidocelis subcapitata]|eukprot:GBF96079.1 peptidyl serine alpha-galactosyltransferase [Raphidocelis subcapitata]